MRRRGPGPARQLSTMGLPLLPHLPEGEQTSVLGARRNVGERRSGQGRLSQRLCSLPGLPTLLGAAFDFCRSLGGFFAHYPESIFLSIMFG